MGVLACVGLAKIISVPIAIEVKQCELLVGRMRSSEWILSEIKLPGDPALREGQIEILWMHRIDEGERAKTCRG